MRNETDGFLASNGGLDEGRRERGGEDGRGALSCAEKGDAHEWTAAFSHRLDSPSSHPHQFKKILLPSFLFLLVHPIGLLRSLTHHQRQPSEIPCVLSQRITDETTSKAGIATKHYKTTISLFLHSLHGEMNTIGIAFSRCVRFLLRARKVRTYARSSIHFVFFRFAPFSLATSGESRVSSKGSMCAHMPLSPCLILWRKPCDVNIPA